MRLSGLTVCICCCKKAPHPPLSFLLMVSFLYSKRRSEYWTNEYVGIVESKWEDPEEKWYKHPEHPIWVNKDGDHVYNSDTNKYHKLRKRVYKKIDWVDVFVTIPGCHNVKGSRMAFECFKGRLLVEGEQVDHIDYYHRENNSFHNLGARHKLFQANNRRPFHVSPETNTPGVVLTKDGKYFVATVREYTVDGPTISKAKQFTYSVKTYGEEMAKALAIAKRSRHTLAAGMTEEG